MITYNFGYMKIHLALLIRSLQRGGAERQLITLANNLNHDLFKISIITFYQGGDLIDQITGSHIKIYNLEKKNRWDILRFVIRYLKLIASIKPDILHGYLPMANIFVTLAKLFYPNIKFIYGVRSASINLTHYDWLARLEYQTEAFLSRFADCIIVNSEQGRNYCLLHRFPSNKIVVIPNGIDTKVFHPDEAAGIAFRQRWHIPLDRILIGLVARLDPIKNHHIFLQAISKIIAHYPQVVFACIGSGNEAYQKELLDHSKQLGISDYLYWIPAQPNMLEVYNALDICCNVSESEGFSNVIGEAMACGIPCVASDVGDSRIIIGETGIIFPPGNAEALAEAIQTMIHMEKTNRIRLGEKARLRIENNYSLEKMLRRTEAILTNLIRQNSSKPLP